MVGAGSSRARILLSPDEGETVWLGGLGVRFMIDGAQTEETFACRASYRTAHPRRADHTHQHEDEYTYVLEGEVSVQVGDEIRVTHPGDLVFNPATYRTRSGTRAMCRRGL